MTLGEFLYKIEGEVEAGCDPVIVIEIEGERFTLAGVAGVGRESISLTLKPEEVGG